MRVREANGVPRFSGVDGLVDAVAADNVSTDACFAGSDVDDVGIGLSHRDRADGGRGAFLLVEERRPVDASVGGLPDATGYRAKVIDVVLTYDARYSNHAASTEGAYKAVTESFPG